MNQSLRRKSAFDSGLTDLQLHVCLVNKDHGIDLIQLEASNSLTNLKCSEIASKHLTII